MRPTSLIACVAVCVPSLAGAQEVDPRALFEKAAETVRQSTALTYRASAYGGGALESLYPRVDAEVRLFREQPGGEWRIRVIGQALDPSKKPAADQPDARPEPVPVDAGWGDGRVEWIDHAGKVLKSQRIGARGGSEIAAFGALVRLTQIELADPFTEEIGSGSMEAHEPQDINGVRCEVIDVKTGNRSARWYLGQSDGLPRRYEQKVEGFGSMMLDLSDLNPAATLSAQDVAVALPDGYTREAAPERASPAGIGPAGGPTPVRPEGVRGVRPNVAPQRAVGAKVGNMAPDFELPTPEGEKVSLSSLRGRVVVLEFWGSWSAPSRAAMPEVEALHQAYKDRGVRVLGLAMRQRDPAAAVQAMQDLGGTFTLLLNADETARAYEITHAPVLFVIGPEGEILHRTARFKQGETIPEIRKIIEAHLPGTPTDQPDDNAPADEPADEPEPPALPPPTPDPEDGR